MLQLTPLAETISGQELIKDELTDHIVRVEDTQPRRLIGPDG